MILQQNFKNLKIAYPSIPDKIIELFLQNDPSGKKQMYVKFMLRMYLQNNNENYVIDLMNKYSNIITYYNKNHGRLHVKTINELINFDEFEKYVKNNINVLQKINNKKQLKISNFNLKQQLQFYYKDSSVWFFRCITNRSIYKLFNEHEGIFKTNWCTAQSNSDSLYDTDENAGFFAIIDVKHNTCYGFDGFIYKNKKKYYIDAEVLFDQNIYLEQFISNGRLFYGPDFEVEDGIHPRIQGTGHYDIPQLMTKTKSSFGFTPVIIKDVNEFKKIIKNLILSHPIVIQFLKNKEIINTIDIQKQFKDSWAKKRFIQTVETSKIDLNKLNIEEFVSNTHGAMLAFIPIFKQNMNKYYKLCEQFVKKDPINMVYIPKRFRTQELCELSVKLNGDCLTYVPQKLKTYQLCLMAVNNYGASGDILKLVPPRFRNQQICELAIKAGDSLEYVPQKLKTYQLCRIAVIDSERELEYVPQKYRNKIKKQLNIK